LDSHIKVTDHLPTFISFENDSSHFKPTENITSRNYRTFYTKTFLKELSNINWENEVYCKLEVHSKYNSFANNFLNICNKYAPLETRETKIKMPKNP